MNLYYLIRNKIDHLRYRLHTSTLYAETLADIGCGNHPQDIVAVDKTLYLVDPSVHSCAVDYGPGVTTHILWADWSGFVTYNAPFLSDEIDCVTLMDVIEHLWKPDGAALLEKTCAHAKLVVVFTPLGFLEQQDGRWNSHRSGWKPEDFGKGWTVYTYPYFHWCDHKGVAYDKPKAALLAIWRRELNEQDSQSDSQAREG